MKKVSFFVGLTACLTVLMPSVALANEDVNQRTVGNASEQTGEYTGQKLALFATLHRAQMNIERGVAVKAEKNLASATAQLDHVIDLGANDEAIRSTQVSKVVELKYGGILIPKITYVPLPNKPVDRHGLEQVLKLDGIQPGDIASAEIKYVRLKVSGRPLLDNLDEAHLELSGGATQEARTELANAQRNMMYEFRSEPRAEEVARDHIALTRFMVKMGEYGAAREALNVAEKALLNIELRDAIEGTGLAAVDGIRVRVGKLQTLIEQRDHSLLEQIDGLLATWWDTVT